MKIIDIYPNPSQGLFTSVFIKEYPEQYAKIFGDLSSVGLDTLVLLNYSDRDCINSITQDNANEYVKNIIALSVDNWVKVAESYNTNYDILNPTQQTTEHTETTNETTNDNNTNVSSNKPYNSTDFDEYDKDTSNSDKTRANTITSTTKVSGIGSKSITDELKKQIDFSLQNWRKSIIFAIVNDITKSIYN